MRKMVLASVLTLVAVSLLAAVLIGMAVPSTEQVIKFSAPAVTENGTGILVPFEVILRPGTGRILVDLDNAYYKEDVENSLRKARAIAARELGFSPDAFDIEVSSTGDERIVSGESAGAFFTVAIASAYAGRPLRQDTSISAVVNEDGTLAPVESIEEKSLAASEAGVTRFVVASGQKVNNREQVKKRVQLIPASTARQAIAEMLA